MAKPSASGLFITIEGIEGAGKSTLAQRLDEWFTQRGHVCLRTREPGGVPTAERMRDLLLHEKLNLTPEAELFIIETARVQLMHELILPALQRGQTVILDRHTDSTLAYQGHGRGLDLAHLKQINLFATRGRVPDWTLLLDLDAETGLSRARRDQAKAENPDRFESEAVSFMERVRQGFLALAKREPQRISVFNALDDLETIWGNIQCEAEERYELQ
ncbi:MAG: dTMP kinase [Candidatus Hinthialibacter antarcticus]|nr:dTMP kinase [Candidatus Hinthialibacter antarcticus]